MNRLNPNDLLSKNLESQTSYGEGLFVSADNYFINDKGSSVAYGTYYYGSAGSCDLKQREHKNRKVY